ncbi:MAG: MBL fold metallo-hydrolase [Bacteroidales bacterium]|jgi:glyoxylase-like metal-dependent hydrolase (beta-lactamase superfamily II)|nr:MBL fold metallo-hydrolase [Bacteroidales bacterium]
MQLFAIETGHFKLDGGAMFGVVPKSLWSRTYPADENNLINMSMRCLLVVNGDRKILINNGMGNKNKDKNTLYFHLDDSMVNLKNSLAKHDFSMDSITDVFLTHLHFDHCGGSVDKDENGNLFLAFPNAEFHVSRQQWEWAINPNKREKPSYPPENLLPMKERLNLFEKDGELFPGFKYKIYNGHTMGQAIPFISYNGKTVVFTSDVLPTSAHIPLPYIMSYDIQPLTTLEEKESLLKETIENDLVLFFEHDFYTECCTLESTAKGVKVKEKYTLAEIDGQ